MIYYIICYLRNFLFSVNVLLGNQFSELLRIMNMQVCALQVVSEWGLKFSYKILCMCLCRISLNYFCPQSLKNSLQEGRNNRNVVYRWNILIVSPCHHQQKD